MAKLKRPIATIAAIVLLFFIFGLRIEHPKGGLKNAVSSASSSLVIVKKTNSIKAGDKIVIGIEGKTSPVLGIVSGISGDTVSIQLDQGFNKGTKDKVAGKLLIVIPFVGSLFSAVGL